LAWFDLIWVGLVGWVFWLAGWLLGWLLGCLLGWLVAWLVGWMFEVARKDAMMDVIPGAETAPNLHHFAAGEPVAQLSPQRGGDLGCQSRQKWDGPAMSPPQKWWSPQKLNGFVMIFPFNWEIFVYIELLHKRSWGFLCRRFSSKCSWVAFKPQK